MRSPHLSHRVETEMAVRCLGAIFSSYLQSWYFLEGLLFKTTISKFNTWGFLPVFTCLISAWRFYNACMNIMQQQFQPKSQRRTPRESLGKYSYGHQKNSLGYQEIFLGVFLSEDYLLVTKKYFLVKMKVDLNQGWGGWC